MNERLSREPRVTVRSWALFGLGATTIALAWVALIRQGLALRHPSLTAFGAALDLVVTMPLVYYLLIVRRGLASAATLVPVAAAGLIAARAIVPGSPKALLALGAIAELAILVAVAVKVRAAMAAARRSGEVADDPFVLVERFVRALLPLPVVANALLYELRVVDWAFFRRGARAKRGFEGAFGWKGADEWLVVVIALSVVIVAESLALHVFLAAKLGSFVWIITALDLYAIVFLVADTRALGANGVKLTETTLSIRFGIRWEADIELEAIERVERAANGNWDRKLALIEEPDLVVVTRHPVVLRGPYGLRRSASRIGIRIDDPAALEAAFVGKVTATAAS